MKLIHQRTMVVQHLQLRPLHANSAPKSCASRAEPIRAVAPFFNFADMAQEAFEMLKLCAPIDAINLYSPMTCISLFSVPELYPLDPVKAASTQLELDKTAGKSRAKRRRSADRNELKFQEFLEFDDWVCEERIRVWKNDRNIRFYDCSCESRKPTHDLKKIKTHVERIHQAQQKGHEQ